ncbi:unnamed protein product [Symbiodinium natans]|uniref:Uncharacterized protein n=1 Tax=Symbiodinium natans TaxID=878477 RepID=A0A812TAX8_9DINO|nr:unnamed protein product [Symbiodinium natans]
MSRLLVEDTGEEGAHKVAPVVLKYVRLHLANKGMSPGVKRELLTIAYTLDQLIRRNILGGLDILIQRLKAIELVVAGAAWAVAQNVELVPLEQERVASVAEAHEAAKEFKQDSKVWRELGKGKGQKRMRGGVAGGASRREAFFSRFLMEYALGSGTSTFAKWLQDFCEGKGASMAEGTTENKNIFPLPLPSAVDLVDALDTHQDEDLWVYLLVASLNYMHGGNGAHFNQRPPSTVQKLCLDYLRSRVQAFMSHSFTLSEFDWKDFFSTQSLNYVGDEVKTAKWTTWANLEPALPYGHIGAINVLDLADGGVRELLMDPLQFLKPRWDERPVRSSRVMVQEADWGEVARGLVKYNLCAVLPESALVAPGGVPLRNGLFGIEKGEVANGHAVHRLIMNLVPFNTVSLSIEGDVGTLPMLSQMNCLQLHPQEFLVVSSEDIRCMYYLFALPSSWYPFLSLNMPAPQDLVPPHVEEPCFLVSKVLPMGYLNSVGIAQHLHRNLITRAQGGPTRCVPWAERIERGRRPTLFGEFTWTT